MKAQANPYKTPKSDSELAEKTEAIVPAGKGRRFLNLIIDYIAQLIFAIILGFIIVILGGAEIISKLQGTSEFIFGLLILLSYYILMESIFGRTIGKYITGTKVVDETGRKPSLGQVIGRSFSRFIPFEAFSFLGAETRGWHDSLPKTLVVICRH